MAENNNQIKVEAQKEPLDPDTLKVMAYQGKTLTVEQKQALNKYNKKIAEMKNFNGDRKKEKRESSKDKFKDTDVVQYMYEDWFLGGLSWVCNQIENKTLDLLDAAGNAWLERHNRRIAENNKITDQRAKETAQKLSSFDKMSLEEEQKVNQLLAEKTKNYEKLFTELQNNYGKPLEQQQWEAFSPEDPLIEKMMKDPNLPMFLDKGAQEIQNRIKLITVIDKLAIRSLNIAMQDEVMRKDKLWRNPDGTYISDPKLKQQFQERRQEKYNEIFEAIENVRALYPNDQSQQDRAVNVFIQSLNADLDNIKKIQDKNITAERFDSVGKAPNKEVPDRLKHSIQTAINTMHKNLGRSSNAPQDLRNAAATSKTEDDLQQKANGLSTSLQGLEARKKANQDRKSCFNQIKNKIFGKDKSSNTHNVNTKRTDGRE